MPVSKHPNVLIHYLSTSLFRKARKKATELAQLDADRAGRPLAIVDAASGRVLKFVRPARRSKNPGLRPRKAQGHVRFRKLAGRTRIEVYQ
jgi:hypothetical protein